MITTEVKRVTVRAGWLLNTHVNVPAEIWRPLLRERAENTFEIAVPSKPTGTGELNRANGHLTGVSAAFEALGITNLDVDRREIRIWGIPAEDRPTVHLESAPRRSLLSLIDTLGPEVAPGDEIFFISASASGIYAYRGVPERQNGTPLEIEWLDDPASLRESLPPKSMPVETRWIDQVTADQLRRVVVGYPERRARS